MAKGFGRSLFVAGLLPSAVALVQSRSEPLQSLTESERSPAVPMLAHEQELDRVVAKLKRLGYPTDELMRQGKERIGKMTQSEMEAASVWSKGPSLSPRCAAAKGARASYRFGAAADEMASDAAKDDLEEAGWNFVQGWKKTEGTEVDFMGLWERYGNCMFTFQGSDDAGDFANNWDPTPISKWGIDGIHRGLATELEPLVTQIDFSLVKAKCTKLVSSVGHSLGGGLAQLFALVINDKTDALNANLTIDKVWTFGGMTVATAPEASDATYPEYPNVQPGCFRGGLFWNARDGENGPEVDILRSVKTGGKLLEPIKMRKTLLWAPNRHKTYECGETIEKDLGGSGFDLHAVPLYEFNLGCISWVELQAYLSEHWSGI
jgi:hypothetical protein